MTKFKSNYSTNLLPKLVGENKHYPPAVKEWSDSVYTYNKNFLKSLPSKDTMANKIIKSYFNLTDCKHLARSKRMRSLIRKLSENNLYLGKPEFKQTNDNVAITVYTLDKERQLILKKIFHNIRKWENIRQIKGRSSINTYNTYDYWRNKYSLNKSLRRIENNILVNSKAGQIKNKFLPSSSNNLNLLSLKSKHLFKINRAHYLKARSNKYALKRIRKNNFLMPEKRITNINKMPYYGSKLLNEAKFLRHISKFKNNSIQARKRVYYCYIKSILSLLGIKILSFDTMDGIIFKEKDKKIIRDTEISYNPMYNGKVLLLFNTKENINRPYILYLNNVQENIPYLDKVNLVLSNIVNKILSKNNLIKNENLSLTNFSKVNFEEFLSKEYIQGSLSKNNSLDATKLDISSLKKEMSLIKDYINLKINYFKFGKYLPALKLLLSKIYNKNIQLNIVRLKYLYLNSEIFMDAILLTLKKQQSFSIAIKESLRLVKIPNQYNEISNKTNKMQNLNVYNSLRLKNLFGSNVKNNTVDNMELVLKNIYPLPLINQQRNNKDSIQESKNIKFTSSKVTDIINVVKYKWVTGVRLELAGRLTRRYTASRSVYKCKTKGSLKNTDFSRKLDFLKKSMPVIMFRNIAKTNSQYTFAKSKRRIGAFGLKGWISSY